MLRPEMPQASKRLGQLNPCCDHNIGIIHTITSNIDKGVKISLETLRVNLAQCFKGVSQRDLCLYEEKIENYDLIIKVYQEIFLMLRECHLTEITENIFNVIANKHNLESFKINALEDDELSSISFGLMYETSHKTMDVIVTVIFVAIFTLGTVFIALEYCIPLIITSYDRTLTPYIMCIFCIIVCSILTTGYFSKEINQLHQYKEHLKELKEDDTK